MEIKKDIPRCSCCILPKTYPEITFDSDGVCNYCLTKKDIDLKVNGEDALKKILKNKKSAQYDCIVPVSGGKDSRMFFIMQRKN